MSFISILLTALALSMDAFAVSITKGMTLTNLNKKLALKIALFFGVFQGAMPLIGWALGLGFEGYIKSIDHWVALVLLSFLGSKMVLDFIKDKSEKSEIEIEIATSMEHNEISLTDKELIMLSIATSIDALAIGVSFAFLNVNIAFAATSICVVTFVMCFIGVIAGKKIGPIFKSYAELLGGVILILIGLNIFNEHTNFIGNILNSIF